MVLRISHEAMAGDSGGGPTMTPASMGGIAPLVHESPFGCPGEVGQRPEVLVVPVVLARQDCVKRMVEIVVPLGVELDATESAGRRSD
jgi:hypothetical protein